MVIDELSITSDDMEEIQNNGGENTEIKRILEWLSVNTKMTLAALSSSSLLDRNWTVGRNKDKMNFKWLRRFQTMELKNIMRTSQNIAQATSVKSLNNIQGYKIVRSIKPGTSSTVPGARPRLMIYKDTVLYDINNSLYSSSQDCKSSRK